MLGVTNRIGTEISYLKKEDDIESLIIDTSTRKIYQRFNELKQ